MTFPNTTKIYFTVLPKAAEKARYFPLTHDFYPKEYHLMEKVIADMKRYDTDYELVASAERPDLVSVWRKSPASVA